MPSAIPSSELNASLTKITRTSSPRPLPLPGSREELSHAYCSDHMATVRWTQSGGWEVPEVRPYENFSISPTASVLHYATECFEGMKVYRGVDGKLRLFRPDCNGERLLMSAKRASLPSFKPDELKKLIAKLAQVDGARWLPKSNPESFLYLRPTLIANGEGIGLAEPKEALLYIIMLPWLDPSKALVSSSPAGDSAPPPGIKLLTSQPDSIRAWPGGFGYAKLGANYGPSLQGHKAAKAIGFDQILWLFGPERVVTEAGGSNFFIVWRNPQTKGLELVTPSLDTQLILPGITRRSVLELARDNLSSPAPSSDLEPVEVVEKDFGIADLETAWKEARIVEAFVSGTAVSSVVPTSPSPFLQDTNATSL